MKFALMMICLAGVLSIFGCGGGGSQQQAGNTPLVEAIIVPPNELKGGSEAVWRVNINGFNGPFTINWDFGGGAVVNEHSFTEELSPNLLKVSMINTGTEAKQYTATVSVSDKVGATDTSTFNYRVDPAGNRPPVIGNILQDGSSLSISASDPDGDPLSISLLDEFGNNLGSVNGNTAEFELDLWYGFWLQRDIGLTVTVSDGTDTVSTDSSYSPQLVNIQPDSIYAVATSATAQAVADPHSTDPAKGVRVIVLMGEPANPFRVLGGVAVTCEDGSDYVSGSFDIGTPDDEPDTRGIAGIDGIWADMGVDDLQVPPDALLGGNNRRDLLGSRGALDFSIIPQGGDEITGSGGVLFSFVMAFSQPGEYRLGFQPADNVSRTYYQDASQDADNFWGDISNEGVPNTITVE